MKGTHISYVSKTVFGVTVVTWTSQCLRRLYHQHNQTYLYFLLSNSMRFLHFLLWQWQRGPMVPQSGFYHQLSTTLLYYSCLLTTIIQCMISNVGFGLLTEAHTSSLYHSGDGILFLCLFLGLFGSDPHRS